MHNAPGLITRCLKKLCQVQNLTAAADDVEQSKRLCKGFSLLPVNTFYPMRAEWEKFFNSKGTWSKKSQLATLETLRNQSYSLHVFSSRTHFGNEQAHKKLREWQLYTQLAYLQCPLTYQFAPDTF